MSEEFLKTAGLIKALMLDDQTQLQLYGLYKQATQGDVSIPEPSDFIGKAKFKAWQSNQGKPAEQAEKEYIEIVRNFNTAGWGIGVSRPVVQEAEGEEEPLSEIEAKISSVCEAIKRGIIDVELIESTGVNCQDRQGLTPLHHAVDEGLIETASMLIDLGANPNIQDSEGMTPLHYAVELDNSDLLALLLKVPSIDTSIQDSEGKTIHMIAHNNCAKLIRLL